MDYESLTEDEKLQIVSNRLKQYEQEHFNHQLNLDTISQAKLPAEQKTAQVSQTKEQMKTLEAAILMHRGKLATLTKAQDNGGKKAKR